jgi:hypothetical protein
MVHPEPDGPDGPEVALVPEGPEVALVPDTALVLDGFVMGLKVPVSELAPEAEEVPVVQPARHMLYPAGSAAP